MTLDGWSLDQKIKTLKEDLTREMRELRYQFACLYDYLKQIEPVKETKKEPSKAKSKKKKEISRLN